MKANMPKNKTEPERPPIVTVLGHVDHGKTTLLDAIRKTNVAAKEAGGITQSIGASQIITKEGKKITFIDTPGHAAFTKMRSRGAQVADIAILVVAAEDGVKPQTLEALQLIKEVKIPFIVAITKIDLPSADIEGARGQLEKQGVAFEGRGGDVPLALVSGKTGKGVEDLLGLVSLVAEVAGVSGSPANAFAGVVIETQKSKSGPLVSAVVRDGTLAAGDVIGAEGLNCKVKGLFNDKGIGVKQALPGDAVGILGFSELPPVGSQLSITVAGSVRKEELKVVPRFKLQKGQIPVIVKARNAGSLEAILANLPPQIVVVESGVGDVFESDILLAKASGVSRILAFEAKVAPAVAKLADAEEVRIESFNIIYELFERIDELLKKGELEIVGKAEIIAQFPFNDKKIAGCKVVAGKITKGDTLILLRGEKQLGRVRSLSLKKQKQEITEAKAGEEFGILFEPQLDFAIDDVLVSVRK
jgi:translation initiation factor IF-2